MIQVCIANHPSHKRHAAGGKLLTRFVRTIIPASCIYHNRIAMIYVDAEKTGQTLKGLTAWRSSRRCHWLIYCACAVE